MQGTELEQMTTLITQLVASKSCSFYRDLYGVTSGSVPNIQTQAEWNLVPTFGKNVMLERSMREYTFVPLRQVDTVYYTSGTSGKPPAFCPRVAYAGSFTYRKNFYNFPGAFLYSIRAQHRNDLFLADIGSRSFTVTFDGKQVAASVRLAKAAGVDSLGVHTFTIQAIGEEMKKVGMNEDIKLIDFVGETCSLMLYSYMRKTFPNAVIISFYSLSETEGIVATPCRPLSDEEPYTVVHANADFRIDLINPATGLPVEPLAGTEAEVLITHVGTKVRGFPLVKYRPGDTVRVVDTKCKEHGKWSFTVLGKTASDFMLVPGGQLRADEVERVLRIYKDYVTDHFEMHRYDAGTKEKPMLEVVLHVQTVHPSADLSLLAQKIQQELRVAPHRTYQMGVDEGRYLPLKCVSLATVPSDKKHRRMFKH
jgi:phenylacetate-coenzyme A ligase PaaK-like adenylate-forming protein